MVCLVAIPNVAIVVANKRLPKRTTGRHTNDIRFPRVGFVVIRTIVVCDALLISEVKLILGATLRSRKIKAREDSFHYFFKCKKGRNQANSIPASNFLLVAIDLKSKNGLWFSNSTQRTCSLQMRYLRWSPMHSLLVRFVNVVSL